MCSDPTEPTDRSVVLLFCPCITLFAPKTNQNSVFIVNAFESISTRRQQTPILVCTSARLHAMLLSTGFSFILLTSTTCIRNRAAARYNTVIGFMSPGYSKKFRDPGICGCRHILYEDHELMLASLESLR